MSGTHGKYLELSWLCQFCCSPMLAFWHSDIPGQSQTYISLNTQILSLMSFLIYIFLSSACLSVTHLGRLSFPPRFRSVHSGKMLRPKTPAPTSRPTLFPTFPPGDLVSPGPMCHASIHVYTAQGSTVERLHTCIVVIGQSWDIYF